LIIVARPPNFDQIREKFPDAEKAGVIFAYGIDIYNPSGDEIPACLLAHEKVHCGRQLSMDFGRAVTGWWDLYLNDPDFRYQEELLAHVAEYKAQAAPFVRDGNARARLLQSTARRLIAPLYNYDPPRSLPQAMRDLTQELSR
jgi:hypothetical protein